MRRKSDQKPHSCTWAARGGDNSWARGHCTSSAPSLGHEPRFVQIQRKAMKTQGFSQAPSCRKREPGRNNPQLWTSNKTSPLPSPCHLCSPPKMPRNDHKGGEFMQLRNTLMGRRGNVEFWKEPLQVIKPSNSSGETQGRGRKEVKRNGHRTRARGRGRKGNKSRHHHHHHQDTTTGRETERFPWAVPRGKGATVSVKYKTQCPPAGGGSRRWDWFGIPRGAEGPVRSRKPHPCLFCSPR